MAPVRRTLVATCRGVGSSLVAKMEDEDGGSSMGPSSGAVVVVSGTWASNGSALVRRWAETRWREVGLEREQNGGDRHGLCEGERGKEKEEKRR